MMICANIMLMTVNERPKADKSQFSLTQDSFTRQLYILTAYVCRSHSFSWSPTSSYAPLVALVQ